MRSVFLMAIAMLSLFACIPLSTPGATGASIYVQNYLFTPRADSGIAAKNESLVVTFRWADSAATHNVVWDSLIGGNDSILPGDIPNQDDGTAVVNLGIGTYYYHCSIHLATFGMQGQITVLPYGTAIGDSNQIVMRHPALPVPAALITRTTPASPKSAPESPGPWARRSRPAAT